MFRLLFLAVVAMVMSCFAAPPPKRTIVHWMSYDEAFEKAKKAPKLIFVDLYADWCLPCRVMDANVYTDPTVASLLNDKFYAVKLDVDSKEKITCDGEHKVVQECMTQVWELSTLPSFVLLAPKGLSILTVTDSMSPQELQSLLYQFLAKEEEWSKR
jgi:uncharacterized protein YyaL (SSP411 family)